MCRTASSFDAQICERSYSHLSGENIPTSGAFLTMRSGYCIAIAGALKAAGLIYQMYELNEALRVAVATPDAEQSWLRGEDVFEKVQRDPNPDIFTEPLAQQVYAEAFGG